MPTFSFTPVRTLLATTLVAGSLLAFSSAAMADVCLKVDEARDTLSPADRNAAVLLLARQFESQGQRVVPTCAQPIYVSHVKFGNSISITLLAPQGQRDATAANMDEVPAVYSQMVHSLLSGTPMNAMNNVDRSNVTIAQAAPLRQEADSLWYLRLGYGAAINSGGNGAPAFGFGYRYELDRLAIDASFFNFIVDSNSTSSGGSKAAVSGSWLRLQALYFFDPLSAGSFYAGGGLGWGVTAGFDNTSMFGGDGLQGEFSAGYEFLRASTIRIFAQADLTLPFYTATREKYTYTGTTAGVTGSDTKYIPTMMVSFGIGWGRGNRVVTVRNL